MGSGCITKWAWVGSIAREGSLFSTYYGEVGVSFLLLLLILLNNPVVNLFLYFLEIGPRLKLSCI